MADQMVAAGQGEALKAMEKSRPPCESYLKDCARK
jgi:hypothetical protein